MADILDSQPASARQHYVDVLRGAAAMAVLSVLWLLVNGPVEGVVLVPVTADHGLTGADVAGLAGLALAAWRWRGTQQGPG